MNRTHIENILLQMGVPASIGGFRYIIDAMFFLEQEGTEDLKYTYLYHLIAKKHNSTVARVERAIRHAFSVARTKNADREMVEHYIGFIHKTNASSLKMFYLRLKENEEKGVGREEAAPFSENDREQTAVREEKSALSVKLKKQESHRDEITHLLVFHDREILREQLREIVEEVIEEIMAQSM